MTIAILLWVLFLAGRNIRHGEAGTISAALELVGMNWMATVFMIFISMLSVEAISGFGFWLQMPAPWFSAPWLRGIALIVGIGLAAFAHVQGFRAPEVVDYELHLANLPKEMEGKVVIGLADMHLGSLIDEKWLEERIEQVKAENPDMIVFLGDTFEGHGNPSGKYVPLLRSLRPPQGVWCVPGNHGRRTSMATMREAGFNVVENGWKEVMPGFVIAGVPARHRDRSDEEVVIDALSKRPAGATLLLAHRPNYEYAETAARAGAGGMLGGHTHGGQIWPFNWLVRTAYPLLEGRYEVDGMPVIVCRGTGTWGPRMRLWARGEILRITLHSNYIE